MAWLQVVGAVLIHLVFLASVFDIYFKSPVVQEVTVSHLPTYTAPARRLVLFIADGLRADSFYSLDNGASNAPFLRQIMENHGTFGVSHTRVPTESRPGHVALIAGMYEDPSAITKGWKENPVDFDSVFNQSRETWSWGSPDILPIFGNKGNNLGGVIHMDMYAPEVEDFFGDHELDGLDKWVFDQVEKFFEEASESLDLQMRLRQDKIVLFLHLLGCDSNGHANKPHSDQFKRNIRVVDKGVKKIVDIVENYWRHDDRTSFIFTSDHGMTDWGSHGTGMEHETQVPVVAWGAGVNHPEKSNENDLKSKESWKLNHIRRKDIAQADLAPFMSALLGIGIPKNSVGKLPHNYLRMRPQEKVEAGIVVAKQMMEMFERSREEFSRYYFHTPFPDLDVAKFQERLNVIHRHVQVSKFESAQELTETLFEKALEGVEYYRKYYRNTLYTVITLSYIGFIILIAVKLSKKFTPTLSKETGSNINLNLVFLFLLLMTVLSYWCQNVPNHYIIYYLTPIFVWRIVLGEISSFKFPDFNLFKLIFGGLIILAIIELDVWSFHDRRFLSLSISVVTFVILYLSRKTSNKTFNLIFILLNMCLCAFTFQPSVGKQMSYLFVLLGSLTSSFLAVFFFASLSFSIANQLLVIYLALSGPIVWLSSSTQAAPIAKAAIQLLAWIIFSTGFPIAVYSNKSNTDILKKVGTLCIALQSSYILVSLTYEGVFLLVLTLTLFTWIGMESSGGQDSHHKEKKVINSEDVFRALFFVHFILVSFFGTGNIASLNSFDPRSIQCLVSVFSPFLMGALLLIKVLIPFLLVALFMCAIKTLSHMATLPIFLLVMLFSDVMGLHFFFLVTDQGSWQEIGTSLSHFVIAEGLVIFVQIFFLCAEKLLLQSTHQNKENSYYLQSAP